MDSPGATMALFPNGTETEVSMPYAIPDDTRTKSSCHQGFVITPTTDTPTRQGL